MRHSPRAGFVAARFAFAFALSLPLAASLAGCSGPDGAPGELTVGSSTSSSTGASGGAGQGGSGGAGGADTTSSGGSGGSGLGGGDPGVGGGIGTCGEMPAGVVPTSCDGPCSCDEVCAVEASLECCAEFDTAGCVFECELFRGVPTCAAPQQALADCAGDAANLTCPGDVPPEVAPYKCTVEVEAAVSCWCLGEGATPAPDAAATCSKYCGLVAGLPCAAADCEASCLARLEAGTFGADAANALYQCYAAFTASDFACSDGVPFPVGGAEKCFTEAFALDGCGSLSDVLCGTTCEVACGAAVSQALCQREPAKPSAECVACLKSAWSAAP